MKIISKESLRTYLFGKSALIIYIFPFIGGYILHFFENRYSICPFMNLTNLPCPFCGLSRAFMNLSTFNFKEAIQYNFFVILFSILFILLIIIQIK